MEEELEEAAVNKREGRNNAGGISNSGKPATGARRSAAMAWRSFRGSAGVDHV